MRMFIKVCAVVMLCGLQSGVQAATATAWNTLYQTTQNLLQNQGDRVIIADNIKKLRANAAKLGGQTYLNKVRRLEAMLDVRTLIEQGNIAQAEKSIKLYGGQKELKPIVPQLQKEVQIARKEVARETITEMQRRRKEPVALPETPVAEKPTSLLTPPVVVMPRERTMPITAPVSTPIPTPPSPVVPTTTMQKPQEETVETIPAKLEKWGEDSSENKAKLDAIRREVEAWLQGILATTNRGTVTDADANKMMMDLLSGIYLRRDKPMEEITSFIAKYVDDIRRDWIKSGKIVEKEAEVEPLQPRRREPRRVEVPTTPESPETINLALREKEIESLIQQLQVQSELAEKILVEAREAAKQDPSRLDLLSKQDTQVQQAAEKAAEYGQKVMDLATLLAKIKGVDFVNEKTTIAGQYVSRASIASEEIDRILDAQKFIAAPIKTPQETPQGSVETAQEQYASLMGNLVFNKQALEKNQQELEEIVRAIGGVTSAQELAAYSAVGALSGKDTYDKSSKIIKVIISLNINRSQKRAAHNLLQKIKELKERIDNLLKNAEQAILAKGQQLTPQGPVVQPRAPTAPQESAPIVPIVPSAPPAPVAPIAPAVPEVAPVAQVPVSSAQKQKIQITGRATAQTVLDKTFILVIAEGDKKYVLQAVDMRGEGSSIEGKALWSYYNRETGQKEYFPSDSRPGKQEIGSEYTVTLTRLTHEEYTELKKQYSEH